MLASHRASSHAAGRGARWLVRPDAWEAGGHVLIGQAIMRVNYFPGSPVSFPGLQRELPADLKLLQEF